VDAERRALRTREARLRRAAQRQRAELVKSRRRDPRAWDYGRYWLIVPGLEAVIGAGSGTGMAGDTPGLSLDEVEEWLTRQPGEDRP
jgi:hypothetical protein